MFVKKEERLEKKKFQTFPSFRPPQQPEIDFLFQKSALCNEYRHNPHPLNQ